MAAEYFTVPVSIAALAVSCTTLWFTLFRRGTLKITRPTSIFFGPYNSDVKTPKIYFKSMFYSTSKRGVIVENMWIDVNRNQSKQTFSIWEHSIHGIHTRGGGLFIGQEGIAIAHHFLLPTVENSYEFIAGDYTIEIHAKLESERDSKLMYSNTLSVSSGQAEQLQNRINGIYFDWSPKTNKYDSHIEQKLISKSSPSPKKKVIKKK